ncbi:trypsin-like serine protease [Herbidospora galbida]|uniref:Trypsin-like serine protease n=1 Tax=Herbidospora galbida TaxID=2575442 RepID=A0A4U3MGV0_9ACTN|nr:serine protease [Herbidospora galbida]TKK87187.1 trypsin-like serine protease [Herbidospora galbida]
MNLRRIIVATAAVSVLAASPAYADETPDVPIGTRLAAQTHPAVQLTSLTYTGKVSVPTPAVNEANLYALVDKITADVVAGKVASDQRTIAKYMFEQMNANVGAYLVPGTPNRVVDAEVGGMCTGWWVTPDGYMVTGAHCVEMGEKELHDVFAQQALSKFYEEDAQGILEMVKDLSPDEEMIKLAENLFINFNAANMQVNGLKKEIAVLQAHPGGGVDKTAKPIVAELVDVGESYPGKDYALLKVNGQQNLPTVPLGGDADVQVGSTLYISGFPGLVTNTPFFSLESKLDPALTEGPYNALRTTDKGVPYIQTQAPSYHGNSGGPVFSKDGDVIGMLIAGTVSEGGEASENESFVLPISVIKEKLNEKGIKPTASATTTRWNTALDAFFLKHYSEALPIFREVQALHPTHPWVAEYITNSQQAITAGKDESPQSSGFWLLIGAGVIVAILLGLVLLRLLVKSAKRKKRAQIPVYNGAPPYQAQAQQIPAYQPPQAHSLPPAESTTRYRPPSQPYQAYQQAHGGQQHGQQHGQQPNGGPVPQPQPYGHQPQQPQPRDRNVADLERELEQLRRQLGNRPPQ